MLKLKYLFDNMDLAKMLVENWDYDSDTLDEMFSYFRISSNAVYPFKHNGKIRFLRFSPVEEKSKDNLLSELEFIRYLHSKGYQSLCTVLSKGNQELLEVNTPWGKYFAVVFERVAGTQLEKVEYTKELCRKHGQYLARLHKLSSEYQPEKSYSWSYEDVLLWIERILASYDNETGAIKEAKILRTYLSNLPKGANTYGLVHYDFELDNVFYDQSTDTLSVIDFEDAMYHWYVMDIEQALESIMSETSCEGHDSIKESFIRGYREEFEVSEEMLSILPVFRRFANLYGYVRILESTSEQWNNEPKWLVNLRGILATFMEQYSKSFGEEIV